MTKSDTRVSAICLLLFVAAFLAYRYVDNDDVSPFISAVDSLEPQRHAQKELERRQTVRRVGRRASSPVYIYASEAERPKRLSYFDPNTADSTQLLELGLPPWMVRGIYKYRARGGTYKSAEDFANVPGLTQKQYMELYPYISISDDYRPAAEMVQERRDTIVRQPKLQPGEYLDLNAADTTQLKMIPGVGSYSAKKIVEYRERLGGFVDVEQLSEIKGLPDQTVALAMDFLTIGQAERKLRINKLSLQQLRQHPYLGYIRAKSICDYRRLKGDITSFEVLGFLPNFSDEDIHRLAPYIDFE